MKAIKKLLSVCLSGVLSLCLFACTPSNESDNGTDYQPQVNAALAALGDEQFTLAQMNGTDALGRKITPTAGQNGKYAGLFYFVATGYMGDDGRGDLEYVHNYVYDVSRLLKQYPDATVTTSPITALSRGETSQYYDASVSPEGRSHYWGEPLYGYYRSDDKWVIRKHLELFINAGIDFLYLDYTNDFVYHTATYALLDAILEMQAEGYNPPKVTFFLAKDAGRCSSTLGSLVLPYYFRGENKDKYASCWFTADETINPSGKPLLVGNWAGYGADSAERSEFWLKDIQWPGEQHNPDAMPWMDWNIVQKNHNGVMNVSIAQGGEPSSEAYYNKNINYRARGWTPEKPLAHGYDTESVLAGTNFEWEFANALAASDDLRIITITGWNEWISTKLLSDDGASTHVDRGIFVDNFDIAYSRDAEMMKGGYGDNYYMQMAENIRKFKGVTVENSDNVALFEQKTVDLNNIGSLDGLRKYLDTGLNIERDHTEVDHSKPLTVDKARNDIDYVQICNDENNLYIAVTCKSNVLPRAGDDASWMNVYLSVAGEGWAGYDFIVGGSEDGAQASVHRLSDDGTTSDAGTARYARDGKTVVYSVPLSAIGANAKTVIGVKAADGLAERFNTDEFYISGDCAPMGRMNYAYKIA